MNTDLENLCIENTKTLNDAIKKMDIGRFGIILVVDKDKKLIGTITDGDVRRAILAHENFNFPLIDILEKKKNTPYENPITGFIDQPESELKTLFREHRILWLPIIDKKRTVCGVVGVNELVPEKPYSVKAVLMAGGMGKRLHPLTKDIPKPMLPVGDKPLMEIIISQLRESGISHINIATFFEKEKIFNHFEDGKKFDVDISYTTEDQPMGTAGALQLLEESTETLLVMNGDILTNMDFKAMINFHRENSADLTVAVRKYDIKVPYGTVECKEHRVMGIIEKPVYNFFVNAGIYLLEPSVVREIPKLNERLEMTDLIKMLIEKEKSVVSFPIVEQWIDIGQPDDYEEAQKIVGKWRNLG